MQHYPARHAVVRHAQPAAPPRDGTLHPSELYDHPLFDAAAHIGAAASCGHCRARRNTWFCGAYFGAGFHEDGLQAGLAVAEALGQVRRPWTVANESGRIGIDRPLPQPEFAA